MALKIVSGLDVTSISLSSYLDLAKNELRNAQIHNLTTTQISGISSPATGQFAFDTTLGVLKVYDGSAWNIVGADVDDSTIELSSNTLSVKAGGIGATQLASSAVTAAKIATGAVTGVKIANDAIDSQHYAAGSIDAEHIATDAVTAAKIADNSVDIARLNVTDGTNGQVLTTNGSGVLSFTDQIDADVTKENLATKLALIDTNTTIGSSTSVDFTFSGDLSVTGDLTVNGTTTTVNSTTTTLDDPIITLGGDTAPTSDDNKDRGVEFRYYDTAARLGFFGYDDSERVFTAFVNASNDSEVFSGTLAPAKFDSITLTNGVTAGSLSLGGTTVSATAAELNILDGVTASTSELNKLDGVTASTAELNILDGVTATAGELNILDGVTATTAELNILDGVTATTAEINYVDGVTSNIQTQLNAKVETLGDLSVTATAAELNKLDGVTATTTELNYVDGVTSAIQTQLNGKQATITGGATTITSSNLTASRALVSNSSGKVAVSAVTSTELGYLDGVTSNVQTQLNDKSNVYTGEHSTSGGTATIAYSTHGINWPASVQVYDNAGQLVLADVRQTTSGENDITLNAADATYQVVIVGKA